MLFNSFTFLVFFLCVVVMHSLPLPWTVRKLNLLVVTLPPSLIHLER